MNRIMQWVMAAALVCGASVFPSCESEDNAKSESGITVIADKVWAFSQTHPDGFTIDIRTMTEPTEGIAVSYAATQNSHSRGQLDGVVSHALQHDGYVGGWLNTENGLYYFDSTKLFPETSLKDAIQFGKENGQYSAFILSTYTDIPLDGKVAEIVGRGTLLVGTTGDYRPLSYREADGTYWGFDIEMAGKIAERLGVDIEFVQTSWYMQNDTRLAAPLIHTPFTHGQIGVLMRKGQDDLLALVNSVIAQMKAEEKDFVKSNIRIYHDKPHPSCLTLHQLDK